MLAALSLAGCGGPNQADLGLFGISTPTPVVIIIATPPFTATPVPAPPVIDPPDATVFAGVGPAPDACDGGVQVFQVTGGAPPFRVTSDGPGCVDATTLLTSGASFTFTAGDTIGVVRIDVIDSANQSVRAVVNVRGAPAAFLKLDLVAEQRSDNGDGTFTSVIGALVTDADGNTVPDGVPVAFTLLDAVAGVSVTSPGLTNQPPPCTPGSAVQPQPGDGLACIKYVHSLQGSTIRVRARVRTANGDLLEDVRTVVLPDQRRSGA